MADILCIFMIYGVIGWAFESAHCIVKEGKWENRGFLFGPFVPIYGVGALAISFIGKHLDMVWIFTVSVIGSAFLEYFTSLFLEKVFQARWWDYSEIPFNLHGRISLFTSLAFGFAGILVCEILHPNILLILGKMPYAAKEIMALTFVILATVDFTLTIAALTSLSKIVMEMEESFNEKMESLVRKSQMAGVRAMLLEKIPKFYTSEKSVLKRIRKFHFRKGGF